MHNSNRLGFRAAVLIALLPTGTAVPAKADVSDYEFQLVTPELKQGDAVVAVRIVDKRSKTLVPNAVVFAKRLDMAPDGMASMTTPLDPISTESPGEYRYKTNLSMEGRWQLSLGAKLQGESGTLQGKLIIKALP